VLDPGDEVFLCASGRGRNEYRVIATDIADYLGPVAAVKSECNTLRGTDSRFDNEQIRSGRLKCAQQLCYGRQLIIILPTAGKQFITCRRLYGAEFLEIATDTGLRRAKACGQQGSHNGALRFRRTFKQ